MRVGQPLSGEIANQVVVPQHVGILRLAADVVACSVATHRRRTDAGGAGPGDLRSARFAAAANGVGRRQKAIAIPSTLLVQIGEGVAPAASAGAADINSDRSGGRGSAVVPLLHDSVIGSRIKRDQRVKAGPIHLVREHIRRSVDAHGGNAFGATRRRRRYVLNGGSYVAIIGRGFDVNARESAGREQGKPAVSKAVQFHLKVSPAFAVFGIAATLRIDLLTLKQNRE